MAASTRETFGIQHTTVVPTNYDPESDEADESDE